MSKRHIAAAYTLSVIQSEAKNLVLVLRIMCSPLEFDQDAHAGRGLRLVESVSVAERVIQSEAKNLNILVFFCTKNNKEKENMELKRVTILSGHYGSGKTNVAINLAFLLKKCYDRVTVADLDIVNPYFRTRDSEAELAALGIELICSKYANSNLDIPALPQELYAVTDDRSSRVVIDVGGDDRGALALGRLSDGIKAENDYEMLFVANCYRPLTRTAAEACGVMREIEAACRIPMTGIINCSNLGGETTPDTVRGSLAFAEELATLCGLPIVATAVRADLAADLADIPNLLQLELQKPVI